jgi:hypothetical protein
MHLLHARIDLVEPLHYRLILAGKFVVGQFYRAIAAEINYEMELTQGSHCPVGSRCILFAQTLQQGFPVRREGTLEGR